MNIWIDIENKTEPPWSSKIDRWYQLDEVSHAFCEALHRWNYLEDMPRPDVIFLALPGASNLADLEFAKAGASSPAKFVYTLPNICAAVILQLLGHRGKIYCINQGEQTLAFAKNEASAFAKNGAKAWLFSSPAILKDGHREVIFENY